MRALLELVSALWRDSKAATAVEYGLILAMIVIAMIFALTQLASTTTNMWNNVSAKVVGAS
ncbi:MAG: Flp family type IVb pilin [Sphingomonas sp.]